MECSGGGWESEEVADWGRRVVCGAAGKREEARGKREERDWKLGACMRGLRCDRRGGGFDRCIFLVVRGGALECAAERQGARGGLGWV